MINEIKRVWGNFKAHIIFLFLVEVGLSIIYEVKKVGNAANFYYYKDIIVLLMSLFLLFLFYLFLPISNKSDEIEFTLPENKLKFYFNRFLTGFLTILLIFSIFYLVIFPWINFLKAIYVLTLLTIVIFSTSIYVRHFKRHFFFFLLSITIVVILIFLLSYITKIVLFSSFIEFLYLHYYLPLIMYLVPLIFFFIGYCKNDSYLSRIMIIPFVLFIILMVGYYSYEILPISGEINYLNFNNNTVYVYTITKNETVKTFYYDMKTKKIAKNYTFNYCFYKNRYGNITLRWEKSYRGMFYIIKGQNYKVKLKEGKESNIFFRDELPDNIYYIKDNNLYKIEPENFKREIIYKNIISYNLNSGNVLGFKKGKKVYGAENNCGIFEVKYPLLKILISENKIYYFNKKKKELLDQNGDLFYKSNSKKCVVAWDYYIREDNEEKIIFNNKIHSIPKYATPFKDGSYYCRKREKITIKTSDDRRIVDNIPELSNPKDYFNSRIMHCKDNYYLFIMKMNKKKKLFSKKNYFISIIIYKLVGKKFEFYDEIK